MSGFTTGLIVGVLIMIVAVLSDYMIRQNYDFYVCKKEATPIERGIEDKE